MEIDPRYIEVAIRTTIEEAIKSAKTLGAGVGTLAAKIRKHFEDRERLRVASERIDEMFRNPHIAWRSTELIAQELNDTEKPHEFTQKFLLKELSLLKMYLG